MNGNLTSSSTANTSTNSSSANIFDCSFSSSSSISFDDEQEFPKKNPSNTILVSSSISNNIPYFMHSVLPGGYKISKKSSNSSLFSNNSSSSSISSAASNNVNNTSSTSLPFNSNNSANTNNSHSRSNSIHKNSTTKKNRSNSFFLSPSLTCKLQNSISSITHQNPSSSTSNNNNSNSINSFDYSDIDDIDSSSAVNDNFFDTPSSSSSKISINTTASTLFNNNNKDDDDIDSFLSNTDDHNDINDDLSSPLQKRNKSARRTQSMFLNKQLSSSSVSTTTTSSTTITSNPSPGCKTLRTSASMIYSSDYSILENKNDLLSKANLPFFLIKEDSVPRITSSTMHEILKGKYADKFPDLKIIDCRFDYEYVGGHVQGAININSQQRLHEYFFNEKKSQLNTDNFEDSLIVFHCEFSQFRGPKMAETLRRFDRQINKENYPNLHYPNLVVLSGGYCDFFKDSPQQCIPRNYITMNDERYTLKCSVEMEKFQSCLKKKTSNNQLYCSSTSSLSSKRSPGFLNSHLRTSSFNSTSFFSSNINSGSSAATSITANSDWLAVSKKRSSSSLRSHKRHNTVNSAFFPALKTNNSFCTSGFSFSTTNEDSDASDEFSVSERPQRAYSPRLTRKSAMLSLSSTIMVNDTNFKQSKIRQNHDDIDEDYDDDDELDDFGDINDSNIMLRNDHHARRPSISMIPDDDEDTENVTVLNFDSGEENKDSIFGMKINNSITSVNTGSNNSKSGITASSSTSTIIGDEELSSGVCNNKHQEHSNSYVNLPNDDETNEDDGMIQYRYSGEERDSPVSNTFGIY